MPFLIITVDRNAYHALDSNQHNAYIFFKSLL